MRYDINEQQQITLYLDGELNSFNAEGVEKEIQNTLENKQFKSIVLDLENLKYISSAGLRVILKLKQKYNDVTVNNANLEVYDIFQMTGFTDIMPVHKILKRVYISGAEVIGEGFFSTIYRIDKDTIIKVFNRTSDADQIERELRLAKEAFILGIPTAISFDIVRVDDKLGVRFEMLDCNSLQKTVLSQPERLNEYIEKYAELLKTITTTECFDSDIPSIKKFYLEKVETIKPYLGDKYYEKAKSIIEKIEDRHTLVHGDCHFKNIMVQKEDLILIDMDTLSIGHPIFELAGIYAPYCAFNEDEPGNSIQFFGLTDEQGIKLFDSLMTRYFGKEDPVIRDKIRLVCYIHMVWWTHTNQPSNKVRLEGNRDRLLKLLDQYDDVNF